MSERIAARLPDDLRERLTTVAQAHGVDYSTVLREALERYLDDVSAAREAPTPLAADRSPVVEAEPRDGADAETPLPAHEPVMSDPCPCCDGDGPGCGCLDRDWCARCFRCGQHCPCGKP